MEKTHRFVNLDFQQRAIITDYCHNLQLTYLELMGYKPCGYNKNKVLPVTAQIREFRQNYTLQAKMLNEIYHLSIWIEGEILENKFYGDIESDAPPIPPEV